MLFEKATHFINPMGIKIRKIERTIGSTHHLYSTSMKSLGSPIPTLKADCPSGLPYLKQFAFLVSSVKHS